MARDFGASESIKSQKYFVYFKISYCTIAAKDPASGGRAFQEHAQIKTEAGRNPRPAYCSRFALSDICCWLPKKHYIRQTEPCGHVHDGGPEPYGRWKWTFLRGNREPWNGDAWWADRYASFGYTSCKIFYARQLFQLQQHIVFDYTIVILKHYSRKKYVGQHFF